jgi:4-hydroxy-2-oxoheptanedioate aldolase
VPANTPEYISRVLDGGALGVIAPHIGSAAEARAVVAAARFPPQGARSAAGALPHLGFRAFPVAETYAAINAATTVMVQFETGDALAKADEIVAVDGVDMVMIGTNDLLADWGMPEQYEHPRLRAAVLFCVATRFNRPRANRSQWRATTGGTTPSLRMIAALAVLAAATLPATAQNTD